MHLEALAHACAQLVRYIQLCDCARSAQATPHVGCMLCAGSGPLQCTAAVAVFGLNSRFIQTDGSGDGMQKEAAWQELLQSRKEADTTEAPMPSGSGAGAPVTPAAAPRIAGQSERCSMAVSADAAGGAVAAAAVQADGGNGVAAEDGEAVALEEDVKSLRKVIADLAERAQELQALQEQVGTDALAAVTAGDTSRNARVPACAVSSA